MKNSNEDAWRRWYKRMPWEKKEKRPKMYYPSGRKMKIEKAFDVIVKGLLEGKGKHPTSTEHIVYAEKISIECNVHINSVLQVLHKLNLEGCCSKRKIWDSRSHLGTMHTRLDMFGDDLVQWEAKQYHVYMDKLKEKYGK